MSIRLLSVRVIGIGATGDQIPLTEAQRSHAVIGYGSLLHPDEVADEFGGLDPRTAPFRLDGYRRVFNNRSKWRDPEGTQSAVLNVEPDADYWCNVVVIVIRGGDRPENYEDREGGYHFERVPADSLRPYVKHHRRALDGVERIEVPVGDRVDPDIEPIPDYVDTCLEGARHWDEWLEAEADPSPDNGFLSEFIRTTELADGTPFSEYVDRKHLGAR